MALVIIKKNEESGTGEKFYKDANIVDDTAISLDFSNFKQMEGLKGVEDELIPNLADDAKAGMDIFGRIDILRGEIVNQQGGFLLKNKVRVYNPISNWLEENEGDEIVFNIWAYIESTANDLIIEFGGGSGFRIITRGPDIQVTIAGANFNNTGLRPPKGEIVQMSYHYKGSGKKMTAVYNSNFDDQKESQTNAIGFSGMNYMVFGELYNGDNNDALYRFNIENITKSGRTFKEVVQRDYDYVNGVGEFKGIAKRPYTNI